MITFTLSFIIGCLLAIIFCLLKVIKKKNKIIEYQKTYEYFEKRKVVLSVMKLVSEIGSMNFFEDLYGSNKNDIQK